MQVNQPQSSTAEAITTPLAVGDKVSYVAISGGGRSYRFSARKAVITAIDGNVATLRTEHCALLPSLEKAYRRRNEQQFG